MHTENSRPNHSTNRKTFKTFRETIIQKETVTACTFITEAIKLIHGICFVISAEKKDAIWILHFVGKEKTENFDTI